MSEDIELQQVVVDGMVIEMGRYRICCHIVCGMLHRRKGVDVLSHRQNDDTAGMLSRASAHARTALYNPVDFAVSLLASALFKIIFHITKRRLIRQCADRTGTERLSCAENNFRIFMRLTLIFAGKVQVDIRLLIPLKSKERFKRNIETVLNQRLSADRAHFIRHIAAAVSGKGFDLRRIKIVIMAFRAPIMGAQGIYLRNPRHERHQ